MGVVVARIVLMILAMVQLVMAVLYAANVVLAVGGLSWGRAVLFVHPIAAIALVLLAFVPRLPSGLVAVGMVLLGISMIADIIVSITILLGISKGDWWLPLTFSIIPAIGLIYAFGQSSRNGTERQSVR